MEEPTTSKDSADIHMATTKGGTSANSDDRDVHMETAKGAATTKMRRNALKHWESELIRTPEVKRKATVAQLCMWLETL